MVEKWRGPLEDSIISLPLQELIFMMWPSCQGEIIIYNGGIADVVLLDQWDDVIYANVCISFLINASNKK